MNLILLNKPYQVLSQFSNNSESKTTLAAYISNRPGYYPAGRLDYDSEGLLLLTNDGKLQARVTQPQLKMEKTYWVQLSESPSDDAISQIRNGLTINDGLCRPARMERIAPPALWSGGPTLPAHRIEKSAWVSITLTEGRNRQVRRMMAAIGCPVLRLVRYKIGPWSLDGLAPGQWREEHVNLPTQTNPPKSQRKRKGPIL